MANPAQPPLSDLIRELTVEIGQIHRWMADRAGLNATDMMAIYFIRNGRGETTPKGLADHLGLTSGATAIMLNKLESRGFIVRQPHPTDRRAVLLSLGPTAHSDDFLRIREYMQSVNADVIDRLTPEEAIIVRRFLADIMQSTKAALHRIRTAEKDPERVS